MARQLILLVMSVALQIKIAAEHRMRELLESEGLPQPDEVEYGEMCVRFLFHESKSCVVLDLDPDCTEGFD